ncbi:hypothetical protein [Streptomyces sp. NPDC014733]|uniref:hypothetical protein n=1 Tax=Streptomyces sp. NPDC014733 TaxID=3364885 RepID=UPI0036FE2F96
MPRGRHRHSPPLHRLLPPSSVAGASIACAAGTWFVGDDLVQRVLAAGAAGAAVTGAALLRAWDRKAGKRVAELGRARVRDEWRTEERIAELESDAEESREIRAALDTKLRAKRAELARLRTEHADLLRRYATSETERAGVLEHRRQLAIGATAPAAALPAPAGAPAAERTAPGATGGTPRQDVAVRRGSGVAAGPGRPAPATFAQADRALRELARNAARQRAARTEPPGGDRPRGRHAAPAAAGPEATPPAGPSLRPVPAAAAAVAPPAAPRPPASREIGGFDFFGNATPPALPAPMEEDLADVVGDEAIAEQTVRAAARLRPAESETTGGTGAHRSPAEAPVTGPQGAEATAETTAPGAEAPAPGTAVDAAQDAEPEDTATDGPATERPAPEATAPEATATDDTAPESASDEGGAEQGTADPDATGKDATGKDGVGEVIDLTAHDETEQLDLAGLRTAIS